MNQYRKLAFVALMFLPLVYRQVGDLAYSTGLRATQEAFWMYAVVMMTGLFIGNVWLGSFLVLNVLLFIQNGQEVGSMQVINVLLGCLLYLFSRTFFRKNSFKDMYKYLGMIVAINVAWMALQLLHLDPIFLPQSNVNGGTPLPGPFADPAGFFGIKMANGMFLAITLPVIMSFSPMVAPFLIAPILVCQSSSVLLAVGCSMLLYTFYMYKRVFLALLIAIPVLVGAYFTLDVKTDPKTFTSRFPVWCSAITYTLKNPNSFCGLTGYGPDSYRNLTKQKNFLFVGDENYNHAISIKNEDGSIAFGYYSPTQDQEKLAQLTSNLPNTKVMQNRMDLWDNPHNEYVNLFFQYGFIGLFLLLGLTREILRRFRYAVKDNELVVLASCLLVYYVVSLTHFPLELARTGYLFPILLGAFYAKTDTV